MDRRIACLIQLGQPSGDAGHIDPEMMEVNGWQAAISAMHGYQERGTSRDIATLDAQLIVVRPTVDLGRYQVFQPCPHLFAPEVNIVILDVSDHRAHGMRRAVVAGFETLYAPGRGMSTEQI